MDILYALRVLARRPALALTALLTLALGIGANTALFAVVYGVLLRPLPWPESHRLIRLSEHHPGAQGQLRQRYLSDITLRAWDTPRTVEKIAAWTGLSATLRLGDEAERIAGAEISPALFELLRVKPAVGTFFTEKDAVPGAGDFVVLSADLWRERFGGHREVVGTTVRLDGRPHVVLGVTPEGFFFPDRETRLWTPFVFESRGQNSIAVFAALARLRPGATPAQAAAEGTAAARSVTRPMVTDVLFGKGGPVEVQVRTLRDELTHSVRPALLVLSAGGLLLLLLACANVANLLLSHGLSRLRELAVRAALGAGRRRLLRQLLTESLILALGGGALGLLLAVALVRVLPALAPQGFPRLDDVHVDLRVAGFAFLIAVLAGVLAGIAPAWKVARGVLVPALREGDLSATSGKGNRLRSGLLVLEAALSVVLLVGAGLLARSFVRLLQVDPGYDPNNVLLASLVPAEAVDDAEIRSTSVDALLERLRATAGVAAAGVGNMVPFDSMTAIAGAQLPWSGPDGQPLVARALYYAVTPGYAQALGLRRREGLLFTAKDRGASPRPMLVNECFVRSYIVDGRPAVGRQMQGVFGPAETVSEIIGVVGDVKKDGLDAEPQAAVYLLRAEDGEWPGQLSLVVRTTGDPLALAPVLRRLVRETDPSLAVSRLETLSRRVSDSVGKPRFAAAVLAVFSTLALLLAAIGLYGVLSYTVSMRKRELGIRAALGASRAELLGLVLRQALAVTIAGIVLGLFAAAGTTKLMAGLLFEVKPLDAVTFAAAPLLLLVVAIVASFLPARRAAGSDPGVVLRYE